MRKVNPQKTKEVSNCFAQTVELLRLEAAAIEQAANRLEKETIERAIGLLIDCRGKVVVLGVGKSGIIGQKIAQSLTSTGTVAIFVHPSDAMHGGLGVITSGDVAIALSNSGETDEILQLLPALKSRQVSIIAIIGNIDSTLARNAEIVLDASVDKEACPLNLAPTASTTVALAIGDALAMALMQCKNWTAEDFAANHPAGRLGKRLSVRVRDLMRESPNVSPGANWLEVVSEISRFALGAVNVVDDQNQLVGIITDGDLRRTVERIEPEDLRKLTAAEMMTDKPIVAKPPMLAFDALQLMENRPRQIAVLPVVGENGEAIGLLRLHDIVRAGL